MASPKLDKKTGKTSGLSPDFCCDVHIIGSEIDVEICRKCVLPSCQYGSKSQKCCWISAAKNYVGFERTIISNLALARCTCFNLTVGFFFFFFFSCLSHLKCLWTPSYRLCKPSEKHIYKTSPLFGQLHNVKKTGIFQVGDVVYKITRW